MDKQVILAKLKELREKSKKRNFSQSIDLIINLKQLDLKKPNNNIDTFLVLPHDIGRKIRICGLVDNELEKEAKEILDKSILKDQFQSLDKKEIKKLARDYDYFIAQSTIMTDIAKVFGKIFGPKGKMPNPKAGCVIVPNANLKIIKERLQKTIRLQTKNELTIKAIIGKEDIDDDNISENILAIYNNLLHILPQEKQNIKDVLIKFTMSSPIKLE